MTFGHSFCGVTYAGKLEAFHFGQAEFHGLLSTILAFNPT